MLVPKRNYLKLKRPDVALNECAYVFKAGLPFKLLARDKLLFTISFLQCFWKYCQAIETIPSPKSRDQNRKCFV